METSISKTKKVKKNNKRMKNRRENPKNKNRKSNTNKLTKNNKKIRKNNKKTKRLQKGSGYNNNVEPKTELDEYFRFGELIDQKVKKMDLGDNYPGKPPDIPDCCIM